MFDGRIDVHRWCAAGEFERWCAVLVERDSGPDAELRKPLGGALQGLGASAEQTVIDGGREMAGEALLAGRTQQIDIGDQHIFLLECAQDAEHE